MSFTSDIIRGHTETIILALLLHSDSYGYEINKSIKEKTGGQYEAKEATLYTAFRRLEQNGFIRSYWYYKGDTVYYEFTVPQGVTANLRLPSGYTETLTGGTHHFAE